MQFLKEKFENAKFLGKYWLIIFDATGLFHFSERHCPHCLKKVFNKGMKEEKESGYSAAALRERESRSVRSKKDDKKYIFRSAKKFWKHLDKPDKEHRPHSMPQI